MTLEKILQSQGFGSRKSCRTLIQNARVKVHNLICINPKTEFQTENLVFYIDGEKWHYQKHIYLLMNKPAGFECSKNSQHHQSVFSLLLPQHLQRGVQCVGRLDQDSTGLLLFSDDGNFIHRYTSPKKNITKTYEVLARHPVLNELLDRLQTGVKLRDEENTVVASHCEKLDEYQLALSITEGKYHQVKRMIAAAGNRVEKLHRSSIANLTLDHALAEGQWRYLTQNELTQLGYVLPI